MRHFPMQPARALFGLTLLLCFVSITASAQYRLYVKKGATGTGNSWEDALGEFSQAISKAKAYNSQVREIWVAQGTYHQPTDPLSISLPSNLALYGGFSGTETSTDERDLSAHVTIMSGDMPPSQSNYSMFYLNSVNNVILDGFTVRDVNLRNERITGTTSAIFINSSNGIRFKNLTIENNRSFSNGGGILMQNSGVTIENSTIQNNIVDNIYGGYGGGIHAYGGDLTLTDVIFRNNINHNGEGGGLRFQFNGTLTMTNVTFEGNHSGKEGGGMYLAYGETNGAQTNFNNVIIRNNTAADAGGGIAARYTCTTMSGLLIENNSAPLGAGIYWDAPNKQQVNNSIIRNNTSGNQGGGMYVKFENNWGNSIVFFNTMISRNTSTNAGSQVYWHFPYSGLSNRLFFINSLVESNSSSSNHIMNASNGSYINFTNTIVAGTISGNYYAQYSVIQGNDNTSNGNLAGSVLSVLPFKSTDPSHPNFYHPRPGGPLQDKGIVQYSIADYEGSLHFRPSTDLAGNPRHFGSTVDIGPYEAQEADFFQPPYTLYVKKGASGSGLSWDDALGELSEALKIATIDKHKWSAETPLRILIAKGTYIPEYGVSSTAYLQPDGIRNTFFIPKDVQLYGGFDPDFGIVSFEHPRTPADYDATILSGDINSNDTRTGRAGTLSLSNYNDNSLHVVTMVGESGTAKLQGLKIVGGNANVNSSYTVDGHTIHGYDGAALWISGSTTPLVLEDVYFEHNIYQRGAIYHERPLVLNNTKFRFNKSFVNAVLQTAQPITIRNGLIEGNHSAGKKDFYLTGSTNPAPSIFENITYVDAHFEGSMVTFYFIEASHKANISIKNSVLHPIPATSTRNFAFLDVYGTATSTVSYSLVQKQSSTLNGNLNAFPIAITSLFKNANQYDYRLADTSPLINAGDNSSYTGAADSKDLLNNRRISQTIDIGAYEWSMAPQIAQFSLDEVTYYANGNPAFVDADQNAIVTDDDTPDFEGGSLSITITNGTLSEHILGITETSNLTVTSGSVYYQNEVFGQVYGLGTHQLKFHFNEHATPAILTELIRNIHYQNSNAEKSDSRFTVQTLLKDGAGGEFTYTSYINLVRTAISIAFSTESVEYFVNQNQIKVIDPQLTVTIPQNAVIHSATLSITGSLSPGDVLTLPTGSDFISQYNAATGTLTIEGEGTLSQWQNALRLVTFTNPTIVQLPVGLQKQIQLTIHTTDHGSKQSDVLPVAFKENPLPGPSAQNIIYVDKNVQGSLRNGRSWTSALAELADALKWAFDNPSQISVENPLKIYVAKGRYHPMDQWTLLDAFTQQYGLKRVINHRDNTFYINTPIELYGGFDPANGIQTLADTRILLDETDGSILSGDFLGNDEVMGSGGTLTISNNTENAKSVVSVKGGMLKIDGFVIKSAFSTNYEQGGGLTVSNASGVQLQNILFTANKGLSGAALNCNATVNAKNLIFRNNLSISRFSSINLTSYPANPNSPVSVWDNVEITGNRVGNAENSSYGNSTSGVLQLTNYKLHLLNARIYRNQLNSSDIDYTTRGLLHIANSELQLTNSLLYHNTAPNLFYSSGSTLTIRSSSAVNNEMRYYLGNGDVVVRNTVLIRGSYRLTNSLLPTNADVRNSLVQGMAYSEANGILEGTEAFTLSDFFTNAAADDYTLRNDAPSNGRTSAVNPLINAGNNAYYDTNTLGTLDLAGNLRIRDGNIDLGPYELQRGDDPLPVRLVSFTARALEGITQLTWKTAEEDGFSHFELESSPDGKSFVVIETIQGGSSEYYTSDTPHFNTVYYRLKIVDKDGSFAYSRMISLLLTNPEKSDLRVYPNPVGEDRLITVTAVSDGVLTLTDLAGRQISTFKISKGSQPIALPRVPAGIYLLRTEGGTSRKIVLK